MTTRSVFGLILSIALGLSACGSPLLPTATPTPTATVTATNTPSPTITSTPTATNTPIPTNTPTATNTPTPTLVPTIALGEEQTLPSAGYSFRPPEGYELDVQGAQVGVFDEAGTIIISVYGATSNPQNKSAEEILEAFIEGVFKKGEGTYKQEQAETVTVDGIEGLAFDLTGTLFGSPVKGKAIVVMPSKTQYLFGLGLANTGRDKALWENEGSRVFAALLDSIRFLIPPTPLPPSATVARPAAACAISGDVTYGYTMENPIKVGGGDFGGPSRERAYLDNLLGPQGEAISYVRLGSTIAGDVILDIYQISGLPNSVTLYVDEYNFTAPQAPVGLTCKAAFPLASP